jgi:type III secretion protein U
MSGEKTEEASDHKLQEARKKGEVGKSADVAVAATLLGVLVVVVLTGPGAVERLRRVLSLSLDFGSGPLPLERLYKLIGTFTVELFWIIGPPLVVSGLFAAVAMAAQVGLMLSFEPITPKPEKVDPAAGVKRLFSMRSLVTFIQTVAKALLLGFVLWTVIKGLIPMLAGSVYQTVDGVGKIAWQAIFKIVATAALMYMAIGPLDFVLQRWLFRRDQKMSKDDQKKEYKQLDGDPLIKGQRQQLARENAMSDPREAVAGSHAVVVNPTHYAVALRFSGAKDELPVVTAKGVDDAAMAIRRHAEAIGVPVFANPPLARALHKVPQGANVPEELFEAVAAILRWVAEVGRQRRADAAAASKTNT